MRRQSRRGITPGEIIILLTGLILVLFKFFIFYSKVGVSANFAAVWLLSSFFTVLLLTAFRNKGIAFFVYLAVTLLMFADLTYFSFFHRYLSLNMLGAAEVIGDIGESIKAVIRPSHFLLFADTAYLALVLILRRRAFRPVLLPGEDRRGWKQAVLFIVLILFFSLNFFQLPFVLSVSNQEIYSFRVRDTLDYTLGNQRLKTDAYKTDADYQKEKNSPLFGAAAGHNVIIIQMESLQNFVIGRKYNGKEITPNLNRLIGGNSLYFDHYYQQVGSGNTSDAEFASNNSLMGTLKSYTYKLYNRNLFRGMPVLLKEQGYETAVFHAHEDRNFWTRAEAYPGQGINRFYGGLKDDPNRPGGSFKMTEWMGWGLTDSEFYKQAVPEMKELTPPFYTMVITLSNHHPYQMLDKYNFLRLLPEDRDTLAGNYLNSAAYTDYAFGELLKLLKRNGLYRNSVIVIYGDHTGLVKSEETNQVMSRILGKPYDYEEMMRIPLIISLPPGETDIQGRISTAGGQLDLLPTMACLLGWDHLDTLYQGQNLLTASSGFAAEHTFLIKGSFFADGVAYEMSRDGNFKNGRAWNTETGEPVSLEGLEPLYQRSLAVSETAQYILEEDILRKIYEEGVSPEKAMKN